MLLGFMLVPTQHSSFYTGVTLKQNNSKLFVCFKQKKEEYNTVDEHVLLHMFIFQSD